MWIEANNTLSASYTFKDFKEAWEFMNKVALLAEQMNHHPLWTNIYNKVTIHLNTHDAGDIVTDKDRNMAKAINQLYNNYFNQK